MEDELKKKDKINAINYKFVSCSGRFSYNTKELKGRFCMPIS